MVTFLRSKAGKRIILLLIVSFGFLQVVSAQVKVSGTVTEADTGDPIPGVNVIEQETANGNVNGTVTDPNGNYTITVEGSSSVLAFSFVGFKTKEETVGNRTVINVSLNNGMVLDEMVVVGFGTQRKESVVGAVTQVEGAKLVSSGTNNVSTALSGKLSGVVTLQTDGKPGEEDPQIFIRGRATWNGSSPLILVDGIERNSWSDIDPNEIESISVLKDASATAVYGARGGNGVILIKTKKGRKGKAKYTLQYSHGLKSVADKLDYLDAYTTLTQYNRALKNDNNWGGLYSQYAIEQYRLQEEPYRYPSVDWLDEMFTVGNVNTANLSIRGGSDAINYFISLGYFNDGDILNLHKEGDFDPRNYYNRYNIRNNLDFKLSKSTTISANLFGSYQVRNRPSAMNRGGYSDVWRAIYISAVNSSPVFYPASVLEEYPDPNEPGATGLRYPYYNNGHIFDNPFSYIYTTGFEREYEMNINTDLVLEQDLGAFVDGLKFKASVSYGTGTGFSRQFGQGPYTELIPRYHLTVYDDDTYRWDRRPLYHEDVPTLNFNNEGVDNYVRRLYYDAQLNYQKTLLEDHYITALAVFRRKKLDRRASEPYKEEAWSGRLTYAYKHKYLFETNLGYTGSEQFAPGNRFGFFPAFALGWNMHKETFVKNFFPNITRLKARYSYGKVGVDNGARWLYYQNYSTNVPYSGWLAEGVFGASGIWYEYIDSYQEGQVANMLASWETAIKQNLGVELQLFEKFDLSIDLFKEDRDNILETPHTIPTYTALEFKDLNIGRTKSHGFEFEAVYLHQFNNDLSLSLNGKFSYSENRILFRDDPMNLPDYQKQAGFPIGQPREKIPAGRYVSVDDVNNYTQPGINQASFSSNGYPYIYLYGVGDVKYVDYNADGVIDGDDNVAYGYPSYPQMHSSFAFSLNYKGFALNALLAGQFLKTSNIRDVELPFGTEFPYLYSHQTDYYTPDNPNAFYPAIHTGAYGTTNQNNPVFTRPISSFVRLKEVELSYTAKVKRTHLIDELKLYVNANNLWTWAPNIQFGDPEKPLIFPGQDNSYPLVKRFNFGITMHF